MTGETHVSWTTVVASALLAVAVSPLLAGWSAALAEGQVAGWWRPRKVTVQRSGAVAAAAAVLGAPAGAGGPWPAWWLFAAGGSVLAVVDAEKHLLPSRLLYPLAALEAVVLIVTAESSPVRQAPSLERQAKQPASPAGPPANRCSDADSSVGVELDPPSHMRIPLRE